MTTCQLGESQGKLCCLPWCSVLSFIRHPQVSSVPVQWVQDQFPRRISILLLISICYSVYPCVCCGWIVSREELTRALIRVSAAWLNHNRKQSTMGGKLPVLPPVTDHKPRSGVYYTDQCKPSSMSSFALTPSPNLLEKTCSGVLLSSQKARRVLSVCMI